MPYHKPATSNSWPILLHSDEEVDAVLASDPGVLRRSRAMIAKVISKPGSRLKNNDDTTEENH